MKIDTKDNEKDCEVISYYDVDGVMHYLYIPSRNYEGALCVTEDECTIIDDDRGNYIEVIGSRGLPLFIHESALDIHDDIVDHQPEAVAEFWRRVAAREKS